MDSIPHDDFDSARAERSLVRTNRHDAPALVAVSDAVLVGYAPAVREAAIEVEDGKLVVRVQAVDDRKWRAAAAGVVAVEHDIAVLGPAMWLVRESVEALALLFEERLPTTVAEFTNGTEVKLHIPEPSGAWSRLPGIVTSPHDIRITAVPIDADAATIVAVHWFGLPTFTDAGLAGFLVHDATGHIIVRRVDPLIRACPRHDCRRYRPRGSRATEYS